MYVGASRTPCVHAESLQSCLTLCNPMDVSLYHGSFVFLWVAILKAGDIRSFLHPLGENVSKDIWQE